MSRTAASLIQPRRLRAGIERRVDRRRLISLLPKNSACAEVGTWEGNFAAKILRRTKPQKLYLIDAWRYCADPGYERAMYGGRISGQPMMDAVHDAVLSRFARERARGQVVIYRQASTDAAARFADNSLDWVYIDGDHTYEAVKADLHAFYRVVRPGGVLAGDDYGVAGWWSDGVTRAVDEFASCMGLDVRNIGLQFIITKAE